MYFIYNNHHKIYLSSLLSCENQHVIFTLNSFIASVGLWLKSTRSEMVPFQKYSTAYTIEDRPLTGSKKRFIDNINYYDHNILGLGSRSAVSGSSLTPGVRSDFRKTHQDLASQPIKRPKKSNGKAIDAHKVCHLNYLTSDPDKDIKRDDKNFVEKEQMSSRGSRITSLNGNEEINPGELCAGCYNCKLSKKKNQSHFSGERKGRFESNEEVVKRLKEEHEWSKQQEKERKRLEREALTKSETKYGNKRGVAPKITEDYIRPEEMHYNYRGYGTDHQKVTEEKKEKNRERMRSKVEEQVKESYNREKEKLLNLDMDTGGILEIPSFRRTKPDKEKYRKELLTQIEANKQKTTKARENDKKNKGVIIESLARGAYVDKFVDQRAGLKEEYYKSIRDMEKKKQQRKKDKEKDMQKMNEDINSYKQSLKAEKANKKVITLIHE